MTDTAALPKLSNEEISRYSRHLILPEVGMEGQQKLKAAKVLCVGTGGLGAPLALYLAAAGVGTIGLVDFDVVDESNLQRQIIHSQATVGMLKVDSAEVMLKGLNKNTNIIKHNTMLTSANALEIFKGYDIIADGTDNFQTRYLVNDACVLTGKPNVYASIFRFEGQASVFATEAGPCYRCLYPEPPPPGLVPSCAEGGVLGILPGLLGVIQATEVIKMIVGIGEPLIGRLLLVDAAAMSFRTLKLRKNPECPACGTHRKSAAHRLRSVLRHREARQCRPARSFVAWEGRRERKRCRRHSAGYSRRAQSPHRRRRQTLRCGRARAPRVRHRQHGSAADSPRQPAPASQRIARQRRGDHCALQNGRPFTESIACSERGGIYQRIQPRRRHHSLGRPHR